jgi:chemotaxis signal transduction protein
METVFDEAPDQPAKVPGTLPPPLAQLLTVTRANTAEVMERLLLQAQTGELPFEELAGTEYLLFTCGGVNCAVPLASLREVVPTLPQVAPLPASPEWLMGIFALRTEMIALIDPAPMLLESMQHPATPQQSPRSHATADSLPRSALIVGAGERCLAWAIALVGDIVRIEADRIAPHAPDAAAGGRDVRQRYIAGDYIMPQDGRRYTLLQTELVLDDVLHALEEEPDGRA